MTDRFSAYIHVPFCESKCPYCDFCSYTGMQDKFEAYFAALSKEIQSYSAPRALDSVYIGGGTPSYPGERYIEQSLNSLFAAFGRSGSCEVSIEANPNSATAKKLKAYFESGANRISIGAQSFVPSELKAIGRAHSPREIFTAMESAFKAGFENINLDLMFGLPGQTVESFEFSLKNAIFSGASHISCYSLTVDEQHALYGCISEDDEREMSSIAVKMLEEHGFFRYEVSNFAKTGRICRHNAYTWQSQEYVGFGAAAHSYIGKARYENTQDVDAYIDRISSGASARSLVYAQDRKTEIAEYIMLALRTVEGIDYDRYYRRFGHSFLSSWENEARKLVDEGLAAIRPDRFFLSSLGLDFANRAIICFL